jgi:hypothetical protein
MEDSSSVPVSTVAFLRLAAQRCQWAGQRSVFSVLLIRVDEDWSLGVLSSVHHRGRGTVCSPCGGVGRQKRCEQD